MEFEVAQVVRAKAGHDKGTLFCVVGVEEGFLWLADGKRRKIAKPKRKRQCHVEWIGSCNHPVFARLKQREAVGDRELRRAIAAFREGGNHAWQKTI